MKNIFFIRRPKGRRQDRASKAPPRFLAGKVSCTCCCGNPSNHYPLRRGSSSSIGDAITLVVVALKLLAITTPLPCSVSPWMLRQALLEVLPLLLPLLLP